MCLVVKKSHIFPGGFHLLGCHGRWILTITDLCYGALPNPFVPPVSPVVGSSFLLLLKTAHEKSRKSVHFLLS